MSSKQQEKLIELLRELFQLNQPDLDFGLYRIMHAKSQEIEQFLNDDLLKIIGDTFAGNQADKVAQAKADYERKRQLVLDDGGIPDASKQVQQALAEYKAAQEGQGEDAELYDHLYRFFERYYDGGDFLARRYYARATSEKAEPYAVPYDGSEVYLHWANKDQYYIKAAENFRQFSVDMAQAKQGEAQLFEQTGAFKLHFTVAEAEEGAHNNVKAAVERYFIVDAAQPLEWCNGELTVRFHYCADPDKIGQGGKWRETRNARSEATILNALQAQAQSGDEHAHRASQYAAALATEIPKGRDGKQTLLGKYLNQYTAKNSMDYFIHKNLGGFLKRELDFYIKNELFRLDDLGTVDAPNPQQYDRLLKKALTLRSVAHKLIEFLAQTEEFQKKLWLKKKFVVDTQWLVTLDKVPASLYSQIEANDAQWSEWEKLGFVAAKAKRKELLKPDNKLVLDTQFFDAYFTAQLLEYVSNKTGNLDEATDGVLVYSENFQALNLMQERYREQVKCIYIDPPYNTEKDREEGKFLYKDSYPNSSWLSLMNATTSAAYRLMTDDACWMSSIDDVEQSKLKEIADVTFGEGNHIASLIWHNSSRSSGNQISTVHEFVLINGKDVSKIPVWRIPRSEFNDFCKEVKKVFKRNGKEAAMEMLNDFIAEKIKEDEDEYTFLKNYRNVSDDGEVFYAADLSGDGQGEPRYFKDKDTTLDAPNGRHWMGQDYIDDLINRKMLVWRGNRPYRMAMLKDAEEKPQGIIRFPTRSGKHELVNLFGESLFKNPKPSYFLWKLLKPTASYCDNYLDYFAGSGTSGHAVIKLNREDEGKRKYILVEMGDHFDTVLKPRIAKVIYSADWKDGKPTSPETGISQLVKVIRLESYEDTLNNLHVKEESAQSKVVAVNPALREDYFLHYLLELETQGSPSLLNVADFTDPTAYSLNIKKPGSEAQEVRTVDLVETFNWLLGLRVQKLHTPQTFIATFAEERDADLPEDARTRWVVKDLVGRDSSRLGTKSNAAVGINPDLQEFWFRAVEGEAPDAGGRLKRVLVVWRKLTGDLARDNLVLEAYLRETLKFDVRKSAGAVPQVLYVNGSHALPAMPHCEVRQLEAAFHHLMWDVQDV